MSIRDEEKQLFNEWEKNRKGFVRDGVVSEHDYQTSSLKIVFILKEVNDPDGGGGDLRKFLSEGARPEPRDQTWDNVTRWVRGIQNLPSIREWSFYEEITRDCRKETLKSIVAMNLKKSPGGHTTAPKTLAAAARANKDYIRRQYSLYDPDITICGGVGELFRKAVGHRMKWQETTRGVRWYERNARKYVVSFSHPAARVTDSLLLYGLLDAVREMMWPGRTPCKH